MALGDDAHVDAQRARYRERLELLVGVLRERTGVEVPIPAGALLPVGAGARRRRWAFAERWRPKAAADLPGRLYGQQGAGYVRVAMVQPTTGSSSWRVALAG